MIDLYLSSVIEMAFLTPTQNPAENPHFQKLRELVAEIIRIEDNLITIMRTQEIFTEQARKIVKIDNLTAHKVNPINKNQYPTVPIIKELLSFLFEWSNNKAIILPWQGKFVSGGVAISPTEAILCGNDYIRTTRFIAGLVRAIQTAQQRFPGQRIHVVDAGCGPFGLLGIAAMSQFDSEEVEFTFLDVFKSSLDCLRDVISTLGCSPYIAEVKECDASTEILEKRPHVAVCEVMDAALAQEPQVAVASNMSKNLVENGILVPENITVKAVAYRPKNEPVEIGTIMVLTKETARNIEDYIDHCLPDGSMFVTRTFDLPQTDPPLTHVYVATSISIFNGYSLQGVESAITRSRYQTALPPCNQIQITCCLGGRDSANNFSMQTSTHTCI